MQLIRLLFKPVLRATPWIGFAPAGVIAIALGLAASRQPDGAEFRFLPTRLGVLAVAIALAFVFDDPASPLTDPAPSRLLLRRLIRTLSATVVAAILVAGVLTLAARGMDLVWTMPAAEQTQPIEDEGTLQQTLPPFPAGRIILEASTLGALALGVAAWLAQRGESAPGRLTASILLGVYAVSWMIPDSHRPWAMPENQRWETGAPWWWVGLGVFVTALAVLSWDTRQWAMRATRRT